MFDWVLGMSLTCLKKPFTLYINIDIHKVVFSFGQNSELRYTESRGSVERCSQRKLLWNLIHFPKYTLQTVEYQQRSHI